MSDPLKSYHFEIVCKYKDTANDLRRLINTFDDLSAKVAERKDKYVVYIKRSQYIRDVLAIIGAHSHVLKMDDIVLGKLLKGDARRMANCDNANMDRAVEAAALQLRAIQIIAERDGLDSLPPKLREVADLRLSHPDYSLTQLGDLVKPPIKKAGMNGRMQKLINLAGLSKK